MAGHDHALRTAHQPLVPLSEAQAAQQRLWATATYRSVLHGWGEFVKGLCCPFLCCQGGPIVIVEQGWVGVLMRFGVFERVLPPGIYVYNCMTQQVMKVCMKMQTMEIARQVAMTKDNLSVHVDAVTFITVVEPARATFQVENYRHAVQTLSATTLLRVIGEHTLQELFRDRARINECLTTTMQDKTEGWGLDVSGVEMRDINIPDTMQRAMAQIAEASREAEAKVIVAEGQRRAASIFAQAAEEMDKNPMSLQLQWFETMRQIAAEKNSTIIVPDSIVGSLSDLRKGSWPRFGGASGSEWWVRPDSERWIHWDQRPWVDYREEEEEKEAAAEGQTPNSWVQEPAVEDEQKTA